MKFLKAPCFMVIMYEHSTNYEKKLTCPVLHLNEYVELPLPWYIDQSAAFLMFYVMISLEQNVWLLNKSAILLRSNEIIRS